MPECCAVHHKTTSTDHSELLNIKKHHQFYSTKRGNYICTACVNDSIESSKKSKTFHEEILKHIESKSTIRELKDIVSAIVKCISDSVKEDCLKIQNEYKITEIL
jgi:hypothetical protein